MRTRQAWLIWLLCAAISLLSPPWLLPWAAAVLIGSFAVLVTVSLRSILEAPERRIRERDATTESPLERMIAAELDRRGVVYEREHRVSRTRIDFAFPASMLAVECDGWRYHGGAGQREHDARRDEFLRRKGWRVMRLRGDEIRRDPAACVQRIIDKL